MAEIRQKQTKKPVSFKKPSSGAAKKSVQTNEYKLAKKTGSVPQLKNLEDEIKLLTSYSSDTIYRLDYRSMKYDYISPAVSRLLGFTPQEMKRINFRSLIVETRLMTDGLKKISSFDELEEKRIDGDVGKWNADYLIRTKSGDKIWVSDISYPWFDEKGRVIGSVGSLRDITERVKIEQKLFSDLQSFSAQDALTSLPGKANLFAALDKEVRRIKRTQEQLSMVLLDIDNLDKLNKRISFDVADRLIIEVSKIIKNTLRETDVVARIDGGTFAVLLPDTNVKGAYFVADRIRSEVNQREFSFGGDLHSIACSLSAGIATTDPRDNLAPADIYKLADTRLYIAKNTGRNQVSIDEIAAIH